jgi:DNA-binding transcriptional MocR family regulator
MSFDLIRVVAKARGLTHYAKTTLILLANMADKQGRCFPSQETMAYETGLSLRQVSRAISQLKAACWITQEKRFRRDGCRTSDLITVHDLETAAAKAAASLKLPLMRLEQGGRPHATLADGPHATLAEQEPTREINQKKEKTGARPPLDSGDRPSEDQHQMAERLRRLA